MVAKTKNSTLPKKIRQTHKKAVLAIVPKRENGYKPAIIRRIGIILTLAVVVAMQFGYNYSHTGSVLGKIVNITPNGLLEETNNRRIEAKVQTLRLNDELTIAAQKKAEDMIANQYWAHTSPEGIDPWYWINETGYKYEEAGENLAKNFTTAGSAVTGWMNSDTHRHNMLKPGYTEAGFGIVEGQLDGEDATIVVALYAKPVPIDLLTTKGSPFTASASKDSPKALKPMSLVNRFGIAIQSLTPAAMVSVALLFISATIATTSHAFRRKLPKKYRKAWYQENGAIKASLLIFVGALIILLYGSGSL